MSGLAFLLPKALRFTYGTVAAYNEKPSAALHNGLYPLAGPERNPVERALADGINEKPSHIKPPT